MMMNDIINNEFVRCLAMNELGRFITLLRIKRKYVGLSVREDDCLRELLNKNFLLQVCNGSRDKEKKKKIVN